MTREDGHKWYLEECSNYLFQTSIPAPNWRGTEENCENLAKVETRHLVNIQLCFSCYTKLIQLQSLLEKKKYDIITCDYL
jgi:hypothetical protein